MKKLFFITLILTNCIFNAFSGNQQEYQQIRDYLVQMETYYVSLPKLVSSTKSAVGIADQQIATNNTPLGYWGATQYLYGFKDGIIDSLNSLSNK